MRQVSVLILLIVILAFSCKKDTILPNGGQLAFSTDTLKFDTTFTTRGSATRTMLVYNNQNQPISISDIYMEKGDSSQFFINVDGKTGPHVKDVIIAAKDSAYVFATVTVNPNSEDNPFFIEDKIVYKLNGQTFEVTVIAYGQNAIYITDSVLQTQTWTKQKPYVIYNNALVEDGHTLTIEAGARVYFHINSRLFVEGTLVANGTKTDSIVFAGDRIDREHYSYLDLPGEWGGLYFTENSRNNILRHVIIKNGGNSTRLGQSLVQAASIQIDKPTNASLNPQVYLDRVFIYNSIGHGILLFGGTVKVENSLIYNCGSQAIAAFRGGELVVDNCTLVTYGSGYLSHANNPVLGLLNYFEKADKTYEVDHLEATIRNTIIYGTLENEVVIDALPQANHNVTFQNCLLRYKLSDLPDYVQLNQCIVNTNPDFENVQSDKFDFRLKSGSPAIDKGVTLSHIVYDLDDQTRSGLYDIGCYEKL